MHSKTPSSIPKCSLNAKNCMKTRIPVYGALGPFPDEPLLSSIDRFLFWFGCKKVQGDINSETSSKGDYCRSHSSANKDIKHEILPNNERGECQVKESPTYSVVPNTGYSKCEKCSGKKLKFPESPSYQSSHTPENPASILSNSCRKESKQIGKPLRTLRQSFSLCSLACCKLKEKLKLAETTSGDGIDDSPKWLWTKMKNYDDGVQVFEVFKNSSVAAHPTKFDTSKAPKIVFVILPTGSIMPFETLPRH